MRPAFANQRPVRRSLFVGVGDDEWFGNENPTGKENTGRLEGIDSSADGICVATRFGAFVVSSRRSSRGRFSTTEFKPSNEGSNITI